jgi:hypothetical protein
MSEAAQAFARALAEEREAALHADFDTLLRVQEEKRALLPHLQNGVAPELAADLQDRARKTLVLLRQLLSCVQGVLGIEVAESTYTAHGQAAAYGHNSQPSLRGRL